MGVEALAGRKGERGTLAEEWLWSGEFLRVEKEFKLSKPVEDSKRDELKVGRPHWQQIQVNEDLAKASKTCEFIWMHFL